MTDETPDDDRRPSAAPDHATDQLFRVIADLLPDLLVLRRRDDGTILHANRAFWDAAPGDEEPPGDGTIEDVGMDFRPEERVRYEKALEEDGEVRDFPFHATIDGETRVHLVSSRVVDIGGTEAVLSVGKDITERDRTRRELADSERRYRQLFEQNVAGTFVTELDGTILACNNAFADMLGYDSAEELRGTDVRELYPSSEDRSEYVERLEEEGALAGNELRLQRRDGGEIWVLENSFLLERDQQPSVNMGTLVDITERKRLEARLDRMAHRDSLTGLPNRRLLREQAELALAAADRRDSRVGLVLFDLTGFKQINDTLGHQAGDCLLEELGTRLQEHYREADVTARLGGDEFAVLLTDLGGPEDALQAARRLESCVSEPFEVDEETVRLSVCIGVACYPDQAEDYDELISHADQAMYRAEREDGEAIALYEPVLEGIAAADRRQKETLVGALERDELTVRYQPVYTVSTSEMAGAEALARWRHPELGLLVADDFVPLAARVGLASDLDRWMLRAVTAQIGRWREEGSGPPWVALNLSASSLADEDLADLVVELLERHRLPGESLVFEVPEPVVIRNPSGVQDTISSLQETGARVAIDDFGSGQATMGYLRDLLANVLKLDMPFVHGLSEGERDERLVRAIAAMARALDMSVVAEGVEDADQLETLRDLGVDLAQGRWTGAPIPADELAEAGDR